MNSWFETHAHLCDEKFDSDREAVIQAAFSVGVERIVEIADGPIEWDKAQKLAEKYPANFYWAAGIHPYYADQANEQQIQALAALASHPQFVAVGEIGLDYAKSDSSKEVQKQVFQETFELAINLKKPAVIHCREAFGDLIPILRDVLAKNKSQTHSPGVIHCFTGGSSDASALIELGFFLGVDAPITYPSANALREVLRTVPLETLVLETDSPYLPPQTYRGKRNEPKYIPIIAQSLAQLRQIPLIELKQNCLKNSLNLFRISSL